MRQLTVDVDDRRAVIQPTGSNPGLIYEVLRHITRGGPYPV